MSQRQTGEANAVRDPAAGPRTGGRRRAGRILLRSAALAFALAGAEAPAARASTLIDFDTLPSLTDLATVALPGVVASSGLVVSEADAALLTGFDTSGFASSGANGVLNLYGGGVLDFLFSTPVTTFGAHLLALPGDALQPESITLTFFEGSTILAAFDVTASGTDLPGGFRRVDFEIGLLSGSMTRATLSPDSGLPASIFLDDLRFTPVPEPGTALLFGLGLAGLLAARRFDRRAFLALLALGPPLAGCNPLIGSEPARIVAPVDRTVIAAGSDLALEVRLGSALPPTGRLVARLFRGIDAPPAAIDDVSASLQLAADRTHASGVLAAAQIGAGRQTLLVQIDEDGNGVAERTLSSTFTPVDLSAADRCDPIDPAHCLFPFPNDFFTVADASMDTGRRVALVRDSLPANLEGVRVDPTEWNRNDGFSPGAKILTRVPNLDLGVTGAASITDLEQSLAGGSPTVLLDATTGERWLHFAELDANPTDEADRALILRPAKNLREGHRYLVALRRLRRADGTAIAASPVFAAYRDAIPTAHAAIEARRPKMETLFTELGAAGIARGELVLAFEFTVASERNLAERMLHIRDDAFASLGGAAPAFCVEDPASVPPVTCPGALDGGNPVDLRIHKQIRGSFEVPLYLTGSGAPGSRFRGADGFPLTAPNALPARGGVYHAPFWCNVPRSATADGNDPVTPARAGVYGHGLLGGGDEINAGNVKDFSNEHNFMFCATNWIGMAEEDTPNALVILQDFSSFATLADRVQQGILDTLFLARLLRDPNGFASHPAFRAGASNTPVFLPGEVFYDGNSQGGIIGGAATAVSTEWTRAVLGVPGMNYSLLLRRSEDFDPFLFILRLHYTKPLDQIFLLSMIQMLWDRAEANGYAQHMTDQPYPGTPAHEVLMHVAFGDHQVADVAAEIEARTIGARLLQPALAPGRHMSGSKAFFALPSIPSLPFPGSAMVYWDSGSPTAPTNNTPPRAGKDPHERPRRQPAARVQKSEFLRANGVVIDVCGGAPCLAP